MKTRIRFTATEISAQISENVLCVGAASSSGEYLMFQRGLTKSTGADDPPYFEYNDQAMGGYGTVQSITLTRQALSADIDGDACELKGVEGVAVALDVSDESWRCLRDGLLKAFEESDVSTRIDEH